MVQSVLRLLVACSLWSTVHSFIVDYSEAFACDSVGVAWTKESASETHQFVFPFYLNIVPFNSTPIIQQISEWTPDVHAGQQSLGFPLPLGENFVLGVTDSKGHGVGKVSSIFTVNTSKTPDRPASCPAPQTPTPNPGGFQFFSADDSDSCPSVNVSWTNSSNPSLFFFSPGHSPFNLTNTSEATSGFVKTSHGVYTSFSQVIVLVTDASGSITSPQLLAGGQDKIGCANQTVPAADFSIHYRPDIATRIIAFILAGVTALFIVVFLLFWHCRRRRKIPDEEDAPSLVEGKETSPVPSLSASMRTNRDSNEPIQVSAVETTAEDSYQIKSSTRRRPNLQVTIPSQIPPIPPVPESVKTGSGFISESPKTARTDVSSRGRGILKKQNTPNSDKKRGGTSKVQPPSSFSLKRGSSSKATLRKASLVSDVTITTEDNIVFPDTEPRPDSPTVPAMYLEPKRSSRRLRRSKSQLSSRSSRRSHRDYKMLQDEGTPNESTGRLSRLSMLSRNRSQSLPRS